MKATHFAVITYIKKHWIILALILGIVVYSSYFSALTMSRYMVGYSNRLDLGHMDQTVWNTLHGNFFSLTEQMTGKQVSRFTIHADLMLALLAPLYLIWSDPRMLLLVQSVALASGAWALFLIARTRGLSERFALLVSCAYLLYPAMQRSNIFEFHAVTLATPLILYAFYFLIRDRIGLFFLFSLLAITTKEHVALTIALLGLYALIFLKKRWVGVVTILFSAAWFYAMIWHIMPYFRGGSAHFALGYYQDYGDTPTSIVQGILTNPWEVAQSFITEGKFYYLFQIFAPVGFLLIHPLALLLLPELAINLLSTNHQMWTIYYQYTAVLTPIIFITTIFSIPGIVRLIQKVGLSEQKAWQVVMRYCMVTTLFFAWWWGPFVLERRQDLTHIFYPRLSFTNVQQAQALVPTEKTISITDDLMPFFSQREVVYSFPIGDREADFVILSEEYQYEAPDKEALSQFKDLGLYSQIYRKDKIIIYKRNQ